MLDAIRDKLFKDLRHDEGSRNKVYLDSEGNPTVGVGHLVLPGDNLKVGDIISDAALKLFFNQDVDKSIAAARRAIPRFDKMPEEFQRGISNFMFQLGDNADKKFPTAFRLMNEGKYSEGIKELTVDGTGNAPSKWMKQTGRRAKRTVARLNHAIDNMPKDLYRAVDTPAREEGTYEIEGPKSFPDEPGYTSPGLGLNPQLPGAPQVQPDFNQLNTYGPQQQSAIPAQMIDANAGLNVGDLRSGIFDEINIPAPELQSVVPEMTPFEAEMALRQQRAAMSGEPPTTAPTPYTGQNGELVDGRMFISGPNQPPGPTRVVNRR
jgi:GH24 family phage-related lysozyme (muramidase)